MRTSIAVADVLNKCEALKRAGMWPAEPHMRPRAWLSNFAEEDKAVAAALLNGFVFYSSRLSDKLLVSSFESIGDGLPKGPCAPATASLMAALKDCVFTPVEGETPNPTDSGHLISRRARQLLHVPECNIISHQAALKEASSGRTVIFLDDFIGSGDQFLSTWNRRIGNTSFADVHSHNKFVAIYVSMVTTARGKEAIHDAAPSIAVCATHTIEMPSTIYGQRKANPHLALQIDALLRKYSPRLTPSSEYIANNSSYRLYGYKNFGLMFAFEHSVPDATLPIFWSRGTDNWEPLIERA